jgi:DNA repair protein RadD
MVVLPTGGGKTVVIAAIIREFNVPTVAVAHRQELVGQISLALAKEGVRHSIIAPKSVIRSIVAAHMQELGRSFYDPQSPVRVAGVDTLVKIDPASDPWFASVRLIIQDEGHHVLRGNKWGKVFELFPNARGLLPTATPKRADGRGLGRHADGYVDVLVEGPTMRELINAGYLTDYRVICAESSVDLSNVSISDATGDFNQDKVRKAVHQSTRLVGDVVKEYLRWARGKLGVTFAVDVESATEIARAFRNAGVPAEVVSAKTPDDMRRAILRRFKNREILQLVNVDLFGEGFDLPAIEVVSMARPTQSYSLYAQQFGRALRLMLAQEFADRWDAYSDAERLSIIASSTKPKALIIDHVENIIRHGLPDKPREWSLDRRERRAQAESDAIPLRYCLNPECANAYERIYKCCPHCGFYPAPPERATLEQVDGDLTELDPAVLALMRGEVARIDAPVQYPAGLSDAARRTLWHRHHDRQVAQAALRYVIGSWAAVHSSDSDSTNYRRFFHTFGVDVVSAMALNSKDAEALREKIEAKLAIDGFVIPPQTYPVPTELAA